MILFLRKNGDIFDCADPDGCKGSTAWSEAGGIFAFWAWSIPGEATLQDFETTEETMKGTVTKIRALRKSWDDALSATDRPDRAQRLRPFLRSEELQLPWRALDAIIECGKPAAPVLEEVLHDASLAYYHSPVIEALAEIRGSDFAPELLTILRRDISYWEANGGATCTRRHTP